MVPKNEKREIMRRIAVFILLAALYGCNSNKEPSSIISSINEGYPLNGTAWQMDYSREIQSGSSFNHVQPSLKRIKMFTKNRWAFLGYDFDKKEIAGMGSGTYTLIGDDYTENIEFHYASTFNGKKFTAKLKFDSLYLYQTGQIDSLVLEERWHRID